MSNISTGVMMGVSGAPDARRQSAASAFYEVPMNYVADGKNIPFEAYLHYAKLQRESELNGSVGQHPLANFTTIDGISDENVTKSEAGVGKAGEALGDKSVADPAPFGTFGGMDPASRQAELAQAQRAVRTASWLGVFYLITTDILGPGAAPYAFSQLGYVPGVILFFIMGGAAAYTGWQLWKMFLSLDSDRYPVKSYGDIAYRIFGVPARATVNFLQSVQLIVNVGLIVLGSGQQLYQMVNTPKACFSVLVVAFAIFGMFISQIKSLQNFSWLANCGVWLNLLGVFITMGGVAAFAPNYIGSYHSNGIPASPIPPYAAVVHGAFPPAGKGWEAEMVGAMQIVFSFGGAMIFTEFMAEMKRPMDFWKAMVCAQALIFTCYMMFGLFVYSFQGQYTLAIPNQGISNYALQTVTNALSLLSGIIAAALYGNIGVKVLYENVFKKIIRGPEVSAMAGMKGRLLWGIMVVIYWSIAFCIGSGIPQIQNLSSFLAALCIVQFTYTFPPALMVGFQMKKFMSGVYNPNTNTVDKSGRTFIQALGYKWYLNTFNVLLVLCSASAAVLGIYASIIQIKAGFASSGSASSFGCAAPI